MPIVSLDDSYGYIDPGEVNLKTVLTVPSYSLGAACKRWHVR